MKSLPLQAVTHTRLLGRLPLGKRARSKPSTALRMAALARAASGSRPSSVEKCSSTSRIPQRPWAPPGDAEARRSAEWG